MNEQDLIQSAQADGLSAQSVGILVNNLNPVSIAGAAGTSIQDLMGDDVTLYVRVIDRSSSMSRFRSVVVEAANDQLDALVGSKAPDSILMSSFLFNTTSTLLHSYLALDKALRLDNNSYDPEGSTALYDAVMDAITSAVSYTQQLRDAGIRVRIVVVIVSDGEDNVSNHSAGQVKSVIEDLIRQEIYTVAFVAFGTHGQTTAAAMGIPTGNVLESTADAHHIRAGFNEVSKSVIRASQTIVGAPTSGFFK